MRALLALLLGCAGHGAPPEAAAPAAGTAVAVADVLSVMEDARPRAGPEALDAALDAALSARGLRRVPVAEDAELEDAFARRRATSQRLAWAAGRAGEAPLVLLVETEAAFYSQLAGRWRWTVRVRATVAPARDPGAAVTSEFTVPVFLRYRHEREEAALAAAAPVVERQVGFLLDEVLGGWAP